MQLACSQTSHLRPPAAGSWSRGHNTPLIARSAQPHLQWRRWNARRCSRHRLQQVQAQKQEQEVEEDDLPPWVRREKERELAAQGKGELPFGIYLLGAAIVSIASIGSWFEIANGNPIFGTIYPGNPLYLPILLLFGITGLPTAGFLFFKCVESANKMAERMDQQDGY